MNEANFLSGIRSRLEALGDPALRDFNAKLIPNLPKARFLGVRTLSLKRMAKEMIQNGEAEAFLQALPHDLFEENQLHAFILSELRDFDRVVEELSRFLPHVDNWATCDQLIPKAIARSPEGILPFAERWIKSDYPYTIRFAIGLLMRHFLDARFALAHSDRVASVQSEEYYVNMMSAWYFATALAKQYDAILPYFEERRLPVWVHNKAIQKARESYRVSDAHKEALHCLLRKEGRRGRRQ